MLKTRRRIKKAQKHLDTRKKMNLMVSHLKSIEIYYFFLQVLSFLRVFSLSIKVIWFELLSISHFFHPASLTRRANEIISARKNYQNFVSKRLSGALMVII